MTAPLSSLEESGSAPEASFLTRRDTDVDRGGSELSASNWPIAIETTGPNHFTGDSAKSWWLESSLGGIELAAQKVKRHVRDLWPSVSFGARPLRVPSSRPDAPCGDSMASLSVTLNGSTREQAREIRRNLYDWIASELSAHDRARLTITVLFDQ